MSGSWSRTLIWSETESYFLRNRINLMVNWRLLSRTVTQVSPWTFYSNGSFSSIVYNIIQLSFNDSVTANSNSFNDITYT